MESKYRVLSYLQREENTTQREIARNTGLSVSRVNILLKRMVKKGLVKTEKLDARSLKYIVTPKGMSEKLQLTYNYIRSTYRQINEIFDAIERLVEELGKESIFYLHGARNEIMETVRMALDQRGIEYRYIEHEEKLRAEHDPLLVWEPGVESRLDGEYNVINVLRAI